MLNITKAESLSLTRERDIWGDIFNYRNRDTYTVRGKLTGDYSLESIVSIWAQMSGMISNVTGISVPFSVNGVNVGTGKIQSMSFDPATDVRQKEYNVSFEVLKTGNLYNLTGDSYEFLQFYLAEISPYFNSLSESYGLSQSSADTVDFNHDISIDLNSQYSEDFGTRYTGAKVVATNLFSSLISIPSFIPTDFDYFYFFTDPTGSYFVTDQEDYFGALVSSITGAERIKYRSENFDVLNGKYSLSERYSYQTGLAYIHEYNHSLTYGQDGVTTVVENGSVKAGARIGTGERIYYANVGFTTVETGIYPRVTGVYGRWDDLYSTGGCPIVNFPTQKSVSRDYPAGQINYSYSYTNDPAQQSGYSWSYENSVELQSDGYLSLSENGSIVGGNPNRTGNFPVTSGAWYGTIKSGIPARISGIYGSTLPYMYSVCGFSGTEAGTGYASVGPNYTGGGSSTTVPISVYNDYNYQGDLWGVDIEFLSLGDGRVRVQHLRESGAFVNVLASHLVTGAIGFGTNRFIAGTHFPAFSVQSGEFVGLQTVLSGCSLAFSSAAGVGYNYYVGTPVGNGNSYATTSPGQIYYKTIYEIETQVQKRPVLIRTEETFSEFNGAISYAHDYTNDPSYFSTGDFVRIKSTVADNRPVHLVNFFNIINFQELAQTSLQSTLGTYSNQVEIIGRSGLSISTYLAAATENIVVPAGMLYPLPPTYTFSPNSKQFNYQQDYIYTKYRAINDSAI